MSKIVYVGLDVHAETINVAVAEAGRDGEIRYLGIIANNQKSISKKFRKLQSQYKKLLVCYEAGPCGYTLYWQLTQMGIDCSVIAPTLIPVKSGDRVKTDKRDAIKLASCHRAGDLTSVWVPDVSLEALRDLVRARTAIKKDERVARHRLLKFLLRTSFQKPKGMTNWTLKHFDWLNTITFEDPNHKFVFKNYFQEVVHQKERLVDADNAIDTAIEKCPKHIKDVVSSLQLMRGVAQTTAIGVVTEVGDFSRFSHPGQLMAYAGVVPSEYSTGGPGKKKQGGITKTGNSHLRRLIIEAAWNYRFNPGTNTRIRKNRKKLDEQLAGEVGKIAWDAQKRLSGRYQTLLAKGKSKQLTVTAVGRELLGFIWSIATYVEKQQQCTAI